MTAPWPRAAGRLACAWLVACLGVAAAVPARAEPARDEVERGRRLIAQYQCGRCHEVPGVPDSRGRVAASLAGFGRRSYIAGRFPNEPATLARWIAAPTALSPATLMPSMGVSDADARAMASYLGSLK